MVIAAPTLPRVAVSREFLILTEATEVIEAPTSMAERTGKPPAIAAATAIEPMPTTTTIMATVVARLPNLNRAPGPNRDPVQGARAMAINLLKKQHRMGIPSGAVF